MPSSQRVKQTKPSVPGDRYVPNGTGTAIREGHQFKLLQDEDSFSEHLLLPEPGYHDDLAYLKSKRLVSDLARALKLFRNLSSQQLGSLHRFGDLDDGLNSLSRLVASLQAAEGAAAAASRSLSRRQRKITKLGGLE